MANVPCLPVVLEMEFNGVHADLLSNHVDGLLNCIGQRQITNAPHAPRRQKVCRHAYEFGSAMGCGVNIGNRLIGIEFIAVGTIVHDMTV